MNKEDDDKTWEEKITRIGGSMLDALSDSNKAGKALIEVFAAYLLTHLRACDSFLIEKSSRIFY